jgi:hypothetical protein
MAIFQANEMVVGDGLLDRYGGDPGDSAIHVDSFQSRECPVRRVDESG